MWPSPPTPSDTDTHYLSARHASSNRNVRRLLPIRHGGPIRGLCSAAVATMGYGLVLGEERTVDGGGVLHWHLLVLRLHSYKRPSTSCSNIPFIFPGKSFRCDLDAGSLSPAGNVHHLAAVYDTTSTKHHAFLASGRENIHSWGAGSHCVETSSGLFWALQDSRAWGGCIEFLPPEHTT